MAASLHSIHISIQSFHHSTIHKVVPMAQTAIRGNLTEDTDQPMWDLWQMKWQWEMISLQAFQSVHISIFPPMFH